VLQRTPLDASVADAPVSIVAVWAVPSPPPPDALVSFTTWASRVAQRYFTGQLMSVLVTAPWPATFDALSQAEATGAITGRIAATWHAFAHHDQRVGSIVDTWTFDPTFLPQLVHDLQDILQAVLPADLGEQTKDAIYGGFAFAVAESLWQRLTLRTPHSPTKVAAPPPAVLRHGTVDLLLPGHRRRSYKAPRSGRSHGRGTKGRRRHRAG